MANMLNSPIPHSIGTMMDMMPCVKVEQTEERESCGAERFMLRKDFKVESPYDVQYGTNISCDDLKVEPPYDGMYDNCNGTNHLSSYADDHPPYSSDNGSSGGSSDEGEAGFVAEEVGPSDRDSDSSSESSSSGSCSSSSSSSTEEEDDDDDDAEAAVVAARSMCENCGKGPFKNLKVHLHHCGGMASPFQCPVCKQSFRNEKAQLKHRARYHVCFQCSEVFVHWSLYRSHVCPQGPKPLSPTIFWSCPTSPPNKCNICKAFFATKNSLLSHMVLVHSTMVTSKVCIITNPALVTPVSSASSAAASGLVLVSRGGSASQDPSGPPPAVNGHCIKSEEGLLNGHGASSGTGVQAAPPAPAPAPAHRAPALPQKNSKTKPPAPASRAGAGHSVNTRSRAAALVATAGKTGALPRPTPPSWTAAAVVREARPAAAHPPIVLRISKTKTKTKTREPKKRPPTSWRSKGLYPCRQCGAVSKQPSLAVSHRYRHRGRRLHRCQCGRRFLRRLHLLRHCVQHAEATSYICSNCGETFRGARLLVEHLTGRTRTPQGSSWTLKSRKSCVKKVPFGCECGLGFDRPSAYIWHQLQNTQTPKVHKKRLK